MSKVYIVQNQQRWDELRKELVPKFDLESAKKYGEFVFLLSPTANPWNAQRIIGALRISLEAYTAEDFLLLIGNPALIGWTVALAAQRTGRLKLLQWSGKERSYTLIQCDLGGVK